ncbi:hypothetical protein RI129_002072 [Pyrocoelia pectoralis]|uniref:Uncharacterized protein n=1 Tax=Pyrocoelia pectoralis TaxID=417401 RepID=A0AAN7ZHN0_9COLE
MMLLASVLLTFLIWSQVSCFDQIRETCLQELNYDRQLMHQDADPWNQREDNDMYNKYLVCVWRGESMLDSHDNPNWDKLFERFGKPKSETQREYLGNAVQKCKEANIKGETIEKTVIKIDKCLFSHSIGVIGID